jgi:5-methyltetrahydropteroyltriglutamate--homocysteine methyltransferase
VSILQCGITGSLPKPKWLSDPSAQLRADWALSDEVLSEARDDAVRLAIQDQLDAGLDIITDGEQRRRHYIWGFLEALEGLDMVNMGKKQTRGARYTDAPQDVARVVGDVRRSGPIFVDALKASKALTSNPVKVTLPGPMTVVDTVLDEHYGDELPELAMRFAQVLNEEARALAEAGADVVQFDEPAFNIDTDAVAEWGIATLERAAQDVATQRAVHICYGYGVPHVVAWKAKNQDWGHYAHTLPLLNKSSIDQVSVECAASGVDTSVIANLPDKAVMLGVVSVSSDEVETPELIAERIQEGLKHCDPERLMPCTDCGLVPRPRDVARAKMQALGAGTEIVRQSID